MYRCTTGTQLFYIIKCYTTFQLHSSCLHRASMIIKHSIIQPMHNI